jgi:hypothetical protein
MSVRSIARRLIGVWLMVDGAATSMWFTGLVDSLNGRDAVSVAATVARVIVAALSLVAGWLISQRRPPGEALGILALAFITIFAVIDAGTGVLPSNLDPTFRWPVALLQAVAASAAVLFLRREARENR